MIGEFVARRQAEIKRAKDNQEAFRVGAKALELAESKGLLKTGQLDGYGKSHHKNEFAEYSETPFVNYEDQEIALRGVYQFSRRGGFTDIGLVVRIDDEHTETYATAGRHETSTIGYDDLPATPADLAIRDEEVKVLVSGIADAVEAMPQPAATTD